MEDIIGLRDLYVHHIQVDHSLPNAYGFIIETSEGDLVCTGDSLFHEYKNGMTRDFIEKATRTGPIALIYLFNTTLLNIKSFIYFYTNKTLKAIGDKGELG